MTLDGKTINDIAPTFGPLVANYLDVIRALEKAINAADKFGPNAVTVSYDPALSRFLFVSNALLPIKVEDPTGATSLFTAGIPGCFDKASDIRDAPRRTPPIFNVGGQQATDPLAWRQLGNTTFFASAVNGNGQYIKPDFSAVTRMDEQPGGVALALQTALNVPTAAAYALGKPITVRWEPAFSRFAITTAANKSFGVSHEYFPRWPQCDSVDRRREACLYRRG